MSLVIDASITLAWLYSDERNETTESLFEQVIAGGAWVPVIWPLEIANGLQQGVRQRRIDISYRNGALADLAEMNVGIDPETNIVAWTDTVELADRFHLTLYDACYLELALRRALPLASLDHDLRMAAPKSSIALLGA